ncbi:MAG TPA: hypothetical protein VHF25_16805 [Nitriliruptorales bacterium]|nr:hypothetical protein [Nitriliruptorales bacterium]
MSLARPPRDPNRRFVQAAQVAGVAGLVAVLIVGVLAFRRGPRPEEQMARHFLQAILTGDAAASYALTTTAYRTVVLPGDHAMLSTALHDLAGDAATVTIIGSERTIGSDPPESLVGYRATTAAGTAEGVVTLFEVDRAWRVADAGYRFVDATPAQRAALEEVIALLDAQVAERVDRLQPSVPPLPGR